MQSLFEFFTFTTETSNAAEQTETSMANTDEITELPSVCDQSTQTEDFLDMIKEPSEEDIM